MINLIISTVIAVFLSLLSTAAMSYSSMATPIGPWIGPTLVLCAMLIFSIIGRGATSTNLALVTSAGSVGGILATAVGFSFPTLY